MGKPTEEDILFARQDLVNELADICWKIDDLEKQITSAMESMGKLQRDMLDRRFGIPDRSLTERIMDSLRRTIDNLCAAQTMLRLEEEELIEQGLALDPLFLCSR